MISELQRARLTRWLCTTLLPIPYPIRIRVLDGVAGNRLSRLKLEVGFLLDLDLADALQANIFRIHPEYLAASHRIRTGVDYHFCALSPRAYADLGSPAGDFHLPQRRACRSEAATNRVSKCAASSA